MMDGHPSVHYSFSRLSCLSSLILVIRTLILFFSIILLSFPIASCGGNKADIPPNVGGGYTLKVSGGTLNDGSGANGLVILATLRDNQGWGPVSPWTITITGPGISASAPLEVEYHEYQHYSYMSWEWAGFKPLSGTYRATATNLERTVTLYDDFTINSGSTLSRPAPSATSSGNTVTLSWPQVANAGSYYYEACAPASSGQGCLYGYTTGLSQNVTFGNLVNGDYLIRVRAYTSNRLSLQTVFSQENVSEYALSFPIGGDETSNNYSFNAALGILDYGLRGPGSTPIYGLSLWTSILYGSPNPTAPPGNWNIIISGPNGLSANFIYPKNVKHYAYWYYSIEPVPGTYTITATYGSARKDVVLTIQSASARLPLPTNISAELAGSDISISWNAVSGAKSYYLNLWAEVWNSITKQVEYKEVWGGWVKDSGAAATSAVIAKSTSMIPSGLSCDVYVTAHEVDMTSASPPSSVSYADMSENYYGYPLSFLTP